jgi:putative membrane protein
MPLTKPLRFILRVLVFWPIQVAVMVLVAWLLPGVHLETVATAFVAVGVIALLNALLWPLLSSLILPFAVLTLGLASLVMNGVLVLLASALVDGFQVDNLGAAILLSASLVASNAIVASLMTIDDDAPWYRNVLRRRMRRRKHVVETDEPGFLFLEFDGLAKPILEHAIDQGHMPTLARWLETGSHRLVGWETDLSSQTSASQAGILHGNNHNIPAFRWYDREAREIVSSSNPRILPKLEQRLSDGNGLLADNGASRGNLFSGDAPNVMNTASTVLDRSRFHTTEFYAFFLHPYNFSRTLLLTIWDIILEMWQFRKARRNQAYPISDKEHRGGVYPLMRAFTTVLMRELNLYTLLGDMFAGVPAAYATFVGYDEVAHHSGVKSEDAFDILHKLDRQMARLEMAAKEAPRPYRLVVLSDHGQTGGATFKQRYGLTLEDLIRKLGREKYLVQGDVDVHEDWRAVNVFLTETVQYDQETLSKPMGRLLRSRTKGEQVALGPEGEAKAGMREGLGDREGAEDLEPGSHIVVLASGNLGLIYGTRLDKRATMEEMETLFPGLLDSLAQHEGIGFVMVHSEEQGPVVIGGKGRYYLNGDRVEGMNPLADLPHAARHLRRNDGFSDAPDLYVNSFYNPQTNEGAAFEEQIGFHGGLGGPQTQPFLLFPSDLPLDDEPLIGAEAVHRVLKGWVSNPSQPGQNSRVSTAASG